MAGSIDKSKLIDQNNESTSDNIRRIDWVEQQTEEELNELGTSTEKKFYEEDSEHKVVTYKMNVVKQYLNSIKDKDWSKLVEKNTSAWIMAVQIVLEALGKEEYDVGKIDGVFGKGTKDAVKKFQEDNGLNPDGMPGSETIKALLAKLDDVAPAGENDSGAEQVSEESEVKVKEEVELPEGDGEVKAEDLVELPEGATAEFEDGKGIDKEKVGEAQEIVVIVKIGDKVEKVTVTVTIDIVKKVTVKKEKQEEVKETSEENETPEKTDIKVKEDVELKDKEEIKAEDLVELPDGTSAEFEDGKGIDKEKVGEAQEIVVIVKIGDKVEKVTVTVTIDTAKKVTVKKEKQEEVKETSEEIDVKVKEEVELPEDREVKAEDLVELPDGATAEFKEGKGVDKEENGEQEVIVVVKVGDKEKEITVIVTVDVKNKNMEVKEKKEEKEEKEEGKEEEKEDEIERQQEKEWLDGLQIDALGKWDKEGKFVFNDGLIDSETGELIVKDKTIPMIEDGGEGFGYMVKNGLLRIGNIKDGVLDGYGVEFYPYGDEYRDEKAEPNLRGVKSGGEWEDGKLKNGVEIVGETDIDEVFIEEDEVDIKEKGVDIKIEVKDGKPTKCYVAENESLSVDFGSKEDGLYLKNGENSLKLKNKYSATQIMKILYNYKDKEGSFSTDLVEGYKSKKLIWNPADGSEKKVVYTYADDLVVDEALSSEGMALAGWLNKYRETSQEFDLENYGEFNEEGNFTFKEGVEKTDDDGKKYIEYNGEKYYEYKEGMNGLGYQVNSSADWWSFYIGNFVDGKCDGEGIIIHSDGVRYEGEWKNDMSEGKGVTTWSNGNKFEGEYKEDEREKGKFTLVTPEEIAGEYEVERDDNGLKIVSGEYKDKYINDGNDGEWKIEENLESSPE